MRVIQNDSAKGITFDCIKTGLIFRVGFDICMKVRGYHDMNTINLGDGHWSWVRATTVVDPLSDATLYTGDK